MKTLFAPSGFRRLATFCAAFLFVLVAAGIASAQTFEYRVRHSHLFRDCRGTLKIGSAGVDYQAAVVRDSRKWKFEEIRTIEVTTPGTISLVTYEDQKRYLGKDRIFEFKLEEGAVKPDLGAFLLERVKRPMVVAVFPQGDHPVFEIRAKHLRSITGSIGTLRIFEDRVEFQSALRGDSRLWRLTDIERFSQPDRYRFQLISYVPKAGGPTEIYNFQLLDELPEGVYDFLWTRLHPSSYYPRPVGGRSQ